MNFEGKKSSASKGNFPADALQKVKDSTSAVKFFTDEQCHEIEKKIDETSHQAKKGAFKEHSVDWAPLRVKYFFGEGYIYGNQLAEKGPGKEKLFPKDEISPVPSWIWEMVVKPLVDAKLVKENYVNSAAINIYQEGGCIVSHIDPMQLFDRPIYTVSFFSDCALSFGCKFTFKPMRVSEPLISVPCGRGWVLSMGGYAADEITHCIRPQDVTEKRAVIILRRVYPDAPRLTKEEAQSIFSAYHMGQSAKARPWNRAYDNRNSRRHSSPISDRPRSSSRRHQRSKTSPTRTRDGRRNDEDDDRKRRHSSTSNRSRKSGSPASKRKRNKSSSPPLAESPKKKKSRTALAKAVAAILSQTEEEESSSDEKKSKKRRQNAKRKKVKKIEVDDLEEEPSEAT